MNRLSPLITRRVGPMAAAAAPACERWNDERPEEAGTLLEDAKLFATGWIGGLVFFGTFLG